MILNTKQAKKLKMPLTIDLREIQAREYLQTKKTNMDNIKENLIKIIAIIGMFYYLVALLFGWGIITPNNVEAYQEGENLAFLARFPDNKTIIGCYNDKTKTARAGKKCTKAGDHNIFLPARSQIKIWLKYFNEYETINRLSLVNFESSFIPENGNKYAYGYVQTLKSYNIAPDINSQLNWLKNRQSYQKVKYSRSGSKRCGYYWDHKNYKDGFNAWEYGVLSCLYRYHYHAHKGTWYAKRGIEGTLYYKWYMFWYEGKSFEEYKKIILKK